MTTDLDSLIDRELAAARLAPRSPLLLDLFRQRTELTRLSTARKTVDFLAVFYASIIVVDVLLIPDVLLYSIFARFVICPLMWIVTRSNLERNASWVETALAFEILVSELMWAILLILSHHRVGVVNYYFLGALFLIAVNVFFRCPLRLAVILSVVMTTVLMVLAASLPGISPEFFISGLCLNAMTCLLTLLANFSLSNERYANFLRTLKNERQQVTIEKHAADLFRLSNTDALTGLANRRAVDKALEEIWRDCVLRQQPFAIVLIDVDYFKRFNDGFGHQAGDRCLAEVARALRQVIEPGWGTVGRYGGEEFIALLQPDWFTGSDCVLHIAEAMRMAVEDLGLAHDCRPDSVGHVTVSLGIAVSYPGPAGGPEAFVANADKALYCAKATGRNCVRLFEHDVATAAA